MSIPNLPVDFKDDILNTGVNQKRKYQQTYNSDGSVSFEDVTAYQQKGSNFGAQEVNETNGAVNNIYSERILDLDELELVTEPGFFVDAQAAKEAYDALNSKISQNQQGKFVIPGGLKIFWGEGQTSASPDDAGVYPATVSFPEPFSNTNYLFICQRWVSYAHTYKENNVYAYLGNDVQAAYAGSPRPNQPFRWFAIGY